MIVLRGVRQLDVGQKGEGIAQGNNALACGCHRGGWCWFLLREVSLGEVLIWEGSRGCDQYGPGWWCNKSSLNCFLLVSHFSQASSSFIRLTLELKARFRNSLRYVCSQGKLVAKGPVCLTGQVEISDWFSYWTVRGLTQCQNCSAAGGMNPTCFCSFYLVWFCWDIHSMWHVDGYLLHQNWKGSWWSFV